MKYISNRLSLCEIELPFLVSRQRKWQITASDLAAMYFCSLCIISGTKQHLLCEHSFLLRDLFSKWIKYFFQQKGSQLHNVLARVLLLFPVFLLLLQHISLQLLCPSPLRTRAWTRRVPYLPHMGCSRATHTSHSLHDRKITACT